MNNGINLLSSKRSPQNTMLFKKAQVARLVAIILLFSVSVVSAVLFILIAFSPLPSLQQEEQELLGSLTGTVQGEKLSKYYITQNRLADVSTLLKRRIDVVSIYSLFQSSLSPDAAIDILRVEGRTILMTITGPTLDSVDVSITKLQEAEKANEIFKDFSISSISYDSEVGAYLAQFQVTLM